MGAVKFYHLTNHALDQAALMLIKGALKQGWRVMIRGSDRRALEALDERLWTAEPEGFLPHGLAGGDHDADQPVLLGEGAAVNGAKALLLLAGCKVDPEEAAGLERVWLMFEDKDAGQVQAARGEWKAVLASGLQAEYWADASGRWEMKAQAGGASPSA